MLLFLVLLGAINCFLSCVGAGQQSEITMETYARRILHGPQRKVSEVDPFTLQRLSTISHQRIRAQEQQGVGKTQQMLLEVFVT